MPPLPLDGVKILDFSTLLPGPLAGLILAEAGAEVIKIERPGGEDMRGFPPLTPSGSTAFAALNGGKKSLALDLRTEEGRAALLPLIGAADVLIEQFRPGVMERLGLGYETLRRINPRLIYCSISGYGQSGPRAHEAGHDINYQAVSGLLSLSPGTAASPTVPAALVADIAGGSMPAVINILLALRLRDATGEGAHLDIAMADAGLTFSWFALAQAEAGGPPPGSGGTMLTGASPRYGLYATADGRFLAVGALEQKFWDAFCAAIALPPDLREDERDPAATRAAVAGLVAAQDAEAWRAVFSGRDCCATIVASLEEATRDPHFQARGLFAYVATLPDGSRHGCAVLPIAAALRRPAAEARPVPAIGEHNALIAGERAEAAPPWRRDPGA